MFGLGCVSEIYNHKLGATKANFKMGGPVLVSSYLPLLIASPNLELSGSWAIVWNRVRIGWKRGRPQLRILPVCVMVIWSVGPVPVLVL